MSKTHEITANKEDNILIHYPDMTFELGPNGGLLSDSEYIEIKNAVLANVANVNHHVKPIELARQVVEAVELLRSRRSPNFTKIKD